MIATISMTTTMPTITMFIKYETLNIYKHTSRHFFSTSAYSIIIIIHVNIIALLLIKRDIALL